MQIDNYPVHNPPTTSITQPPSALPNTGGDWVIYTNPALFLIICGMIILLFVWAGRHRLDD